MRKKILYLLPLAIVMSIQGYSQGTWTSLAHNAPDANGGVMLLLPDGRVMVKTETGGSYGKKWDILTPDSHGSYQNGTWTTTDTMVNDRLYFSTQVLRDGRVYAAGGEYGTPGGDKGEIYDPQANTWTAAPTTGMHISDANSEILPDGRVLQAFVGSGTKHTRLWDPVTNTYASGPDCLRINNEAPWVKLPDQSILFIDNYGTTSERYIPATNTWINDSTVPVSLYDPYGDEMGAGFLLPDGRAFFLGSSGHTAFYTPSGTTAKGVWNAGPDIPSTQGTPDAPAAMMPNGKILCVVSPVPTSGDHFPDSSRFYEFDYTTNTYTLVNTPIGGTLMSGFPTFISNMLVLPDGNVLYSIQGNTPYFIYTPSGSPVSSGKPTVSAVTRVNCDTFTATGTLFNGISEGAAYGDDWQMESNYPLIKLTSGTNVYYTRTYNWNRTDVMTGSAADTVQFILPAGLPAGTYSLQVVANGIASSSFSFNPSLTISPSSAVLCPTATTTLTDAWPGGTWSSASTTVATVNSSTGLLTGVASGTTNITYTYSPGCFATAPVTVNTATSPISGPTNVCPGATITLTDAGGGAWSSNNTSIATVGSSSGVVTGVASGTVTITYALGGCYATSLITVNPTPATITGTLNVCTGLTTTLSDASSGGTWSSGSTTVATVGSGSGIVTGVSAGTATISYTTSLSCSATMVVTVNTQTAAIGGTGTVCAGSTTTLTDATSSGAWSSGNTSLATVVSGTGVVTGVSAGNPVITYTTAGGCFSTSIITVNPQPSAITGTTTACTGNTMSLSSTTSGGVWTSATTSVATVASSSGTVTAVSPGTSVISYTLPTSCAVSTTITVTSSPAAITGTQQVCEGATTALSDATGGGTWSSSSTANATVSGSGTVTGVAAGTTTISYSLGAGCLSTAIVTINPAPTSIGGTTTLCAGSATTLTDATTGGTWSSGSTSVATVVAGTGLVSGVSGGTANISYITAAGCVTSTTVTVNALPSGISGGTSMCIGSSLTLTDATSGGTWSSNNTSVASIDPSTGSVSGLTTGSATITYMLATGCYTTESLSVNGAPMPIGGSTAVCQGATGTLTDATTGGTWSSGNTSLATIVSGTGVMTGVATGNPVITYTIPGGCYTTVTATVNALPAAVATASAICAGTTVTYTDGTTGGTWSSANTTIASVDASTGVVSGLTAGNTTISYTLATGCWGVAGITVNPLPAAIGGAGSVCEGATATLTDATTGGAWSSGNTSLATIVSSTGVINGISSGTVPVTYTLPTGCIATGSVAVNPAAGPITGTAQACIGATSALSDATTGGTWSVSNTSIATVVSGTGVVNGVSGGSVTITYTTSAGCIQTTAFTVNPLPAAISGPSAVCIGLNITLTDANSGGTWSSDNTSVASVSSGGIVTGIGAGTANIIYTVSTGCEVSRAVTVNASPGTISGASAFCAGTSILLTDAGGGTWSSSTTSVATVVSSTGIVYGVSGGTATITYSLGAGCIATAVVSVNPLPATIGGANHVCQGSSTTLTDATSGGTWSSNNTAIATVSVSGVVTGVASGTCSITYTLPTGCAVSMAFTVNAVPTPITGTAGVCVGSATTLSDGTGGGTWSSSNTTIASVVSTTGVVTGISAGSATITYTIGSACSATATVSVSALPATITGTTNVCVGATRTLTDATSGGTWTCANTSMATVDMLTGIVSGITAGTTTITYTSAMGCVRTTSFVVNPLPSPITGTPAGCIGTVTTLGDATTGGTWASTNTAIATMVSTLGNVTGVSAGSVNINYTSSLGCVVTVVFTVNPLPGAITGTRTVCGSLTTTLGDPTTGGTWSSASTAIATVGSLTGLVTGGSAGTTTITYTAPGGCKTTAVVTVNSLSPITGLGSVCLGQTITLSDATGGGTWSSSSTGIASINTSGVVYGLSAGSATITYSLPTGCKATKVLAISSLSTPISGGTMVCKGQSITLGNATGGGVWSSNNPYIANINASTGVVAGVATGIVTITYTIGTGCRVTMPLTVDPLSPIAGPTSVCVGQTIFVSDATLGGAWSCSNTLLGTISGGNVTGISAGTIVISYVMPTGCTSISNVTVNPLSSITGPGSVCVGQTVSLANSTGPGTWSSNNSYIASIGSTGVARGVASGIVTITYSVNATGCKATRPLTVNPLSPIAGPATVCMGQTIFVSDATLGGTWSSSNTTVGTISGGNITGLSAGLTNISYILATGCTSVSTVTVNPLSPITGPGSVCVGQTVTLSNVTGAGTWASNNASIAAISSASGVASGVASGIVNITYTVTGTGCKATRPLTVNPLSLIAGAASVCIGSTTYLSDATTGGTWSSSNTSLASIGLTSGMVTGVAAGMSTITYTTALGCMATKTMSVNACSLPVSGGIVVCAGTTAHLTADTRGGQWMSSDEAIAAADPNGLVMGVSSGSAMILYVVNGEVMQQVPVQVYAAQQPVLITAYPGSEVFAGEAVTLTATYEGNVPGTTLQWLLNGASVPGENGTTFTRNNFSNNDIISCTATNACGAITAANPVTIALISNGCSGVPGFSDLSILPNPSRGTLVIRGNTGNAASEDILVRVADMLGRVVFERHIASVSGSINETIQLDPSLANGTYVLSLGSGKGVAVYHVVLDK